MKYYYFILFVLLISSCSFYSNERYITISGLEKGLLVLSSKSNHREIPIKEGCYELEVSIEKGEIYVANFYPYFVNSLSRFSKGGIVEVNNYQVYLSNKLGPLTMVCESFFTSGELIDYDNLIGLADNITDLVDPWSMIREDLVLALCGKISWNTVSNYSFVELPELDFFSYIIPENDLFTGWYPSVQSFYDLDNKVYYRIEIYNDNSYTYFSQVNY